MTVKFTSLNLSKQARKIEVHSSPNTISAEWYLVRNASTQKSCVL